MMKNTKKRRGAKKLATQLGVDLYSTVANETLYDTLKKLGYRWDIEKSKWRKLQRYRGSNQN